MNASIGTLDFSVRDAQEAFWPSAPFSFGAANATRSPLWVSLDGGANVEDRIPPGGTREFEVEFRFGPPGSDGLELGRETLESYADRHPMALRWPDRRPIGLDMISLIGLPATPTNPRAWAPAGNFGAVDVTTIDGLRAFRRDLLARADAEIEVLGRMNAQGTIAWDLEGAEFPEAVFVGDPRLVPALAPEMEFADETGERTVDAYMRRYREAGFRVGVTLRGQKAERVNGRVEHRVYGDTAEAIEDLGAKAAYARDRWGCTLFYVDSTVDHSGPLDPAVFEALLRRFPNTLFIPENESARYFSSTAPLNSFTHHGVSGTPRTVRALYPDAFSVLLANGVGSRPEAHAALADSVRRGDILLVNAWYENQDIDAVTRIYHAAGR
jgi:hypothetical protein